MLWNGMDVDDDDEPVSVPENRVRHGGLMRCCLATLEECGAGTEGQLLTCRFESASNGPQMVWHNGAWQWTGTGDEREEWIRRTYAADVIVQLSRSVPT